MIVLYLIFIIIFCYFLFDRLTYKYLPIYTLDVYMGKKGSGKTTHATYMALKYIKDGWNVYSNFYIPGTYYYDVNDFGSYQFKEHSLIICDEAGILFNNRDFKTLKQQVRDFLALQRKYSNKVIMYSQSYNVDKAIRDLADNLYTITKVARVLTFVRHINKRIGIKNDGESGGQLIEEYKYVGLPKIVFIPRYTCLFDSFDRPKLEEIKAVYQELDDLQKELVTFKGFIVFKAQSLFKYIKKFFHKEKKLKSECSDDYTLEDFSKLVIENEEDFYRE